MTIDRFTARRDEGDDYRRQELIDKIERAVRALPVARLEALAYDMFAKGYLDE